MVDPEHFISLNLTEQLKFLDEFQTVLDSIGGKGYLNCQNLTTFPIVSVLLTSFINGGNEAEALEFINGTKVWKIISDCTMS